MKLIAKIVNNAAINVAKTNQSKCAIIGFSEPKMPNNMIK